MRTTLQNSVRDDTGDTATCPKCGAAGRMMTSDEMDARVEEARREGTIDSDELRRRLGL